MILLSRSGESAGGKAEARLCASMIGVAQGHGSDGGEKSELAYCYLDGTASSSSKDNASLRRW
jgi:hypothetical protein